MQNIIPVTNLIVIDGEPRIRDLDLAAWLGLGQVLNIRQVISANRNELETHGGFHVANENPGKQGGSPGKAYYLNEGQALVICALSRTDKAAQVRKALIDVFMAYRKGKLVHVNEHRRRLPNRAKPQRDTYDSNLNFLKAFAGQPEAMLSLMAGMLARLDQLETGA